MDAGRGGPHVERAAAVTRDRGGLAARGERRGRAIGSSGRHLTPSSAFTVTEFIGFVVTFTRWVTSTASDPTADSEPKEWVTSRDKYKGGRGDNKASSSRGARSERHKRTLTETTQATQDLALLRARSQGTWNVPGALDRRDYNDHISVFDIGRQVALAKCTAPS